MVLPDVNILVAAYRSDAPAHARCRAWLEKTLGGDEAFAVAELALSGFLRVATHPRVFALPSPLDEAIQFVNIVRSQPHCVTISPGARHWKIFSRMCRDAEATGNLVPDAYFAALAIEHGCEWITLDRDFARFDGLRWRTPPHAAAIP